MHGVIPHVELNDYKSLRAKMSCGHTVTPMSLTNWCRKSLDKGETKFVCGHCDVEWPYNEVYKMALLTPEEIKYFEKTLFKTAATDFWNAKKCPGCKSCVVRNDLNNARVCCTVCSTNKRRIYEFCWRCLKEWTRPSPYSDRCADPDCVTPEETLRTCPEITFKDVKNVTGCPSVRACPTCGLLIEHNKKNCKYITCLRCKEKFCFVCLKLNKVCDKYYGPCISGVAPRQTTIPVWKRK
uniref:E3 ubiquitin-protein ligase ARIH2-like n=1 Tax=Semicossyphus pulcher TaxID=241346 RepID=UPI0037E7405E